MYFVFITVKYSELSLRGTCRVGETVSCIYVLYNYLFKTLYTGDNRDSKWLPMFIITIIIREIEEAFCIYIQKHQTCLFSC